MHEVKPKVKKVEAPLVSAISFKNIGFQYNKNKTKALDDINIDIPKGKFVCILGHNGSGKSTFSKLAVGLLKPSEGTYELDGVEIKQETIPILRRKVGIVFQNPDNQFIQPTVRDDIAFGLENRKVPREEMDDIILRAAKAVNIEEYLDSAPEMLSGGLKQRVAIASQIALDFETIIFDEATSMLDPNGRHEVINIMKILNKERGKTIVTITHFMDEAIQADYIYVFHGGKVIAHGKPTEVFKNEEALHKTRLDFPFIYDLSKKLNKKDPRIKPTFDEKELLNQLWKLK